MRLIDAEALKNIYAQIIAKLEAVSDGNIIPLIAKMAISALMDCIEYQPTIEAKPVVHAHWEYRTWEGDFCSNCGESAIEGRYAYQVLSNYCPFCGAQMDELVSKADELNSSEKPNSCDHIAEVGKKEPFPQAHENGVKIPVISMEDVPKIMEEMENNGASRNNA